MTITQRSHQTQAEPTLPELSEIERTALVLIRNEGPLSRTALAEMLGVSRASITAVVGHLVDAGVLEEVGQGRSEGGRPPMLLDVNSELGYIVGVDIGATSAGHIAGYYPDIQFLQLPYLFKSMAHYKVARRSGVVNEIMREVSKATGLIALGIYSDCNGFAISSTTPITKIEDAKGVKLRCMQNPLFVDIYKDFGLP